MLDTVGQRIAHHHELLGQKVRCAAACHTGGGNTVLPDHTLQKAAIKKFLDGGLNITAIVYQVSHWSCGSTIKNKKVYFSVPLEAVVHRQFWSRMDVIAEI